MNYRLLIIFIIVIIFVLYTCILFTHTSTFTNKSKKNLKQPFDMKWNTLDIGILQNIKTDKYFIYDETLLGLVKLNKFIPWNKNITIAIPEDIKIKNKNISTVKYEIKENKVIITDKWKNTTFEIDNNIIFPLKNINNISYPNQPEKLLSIIYPYDWNNLCKSMELDKITNKKYNIFTTSWNQIISPPSAQDLFNNTWVINLSKREDRWKSTQERLGKINIHPKRWDAIDATTTVTRNIYKEVFDKESSDHLTLRELACYLSHYSLWVDLLKKKVPYALILEDDIILPDITGMIDFQKILDHSLGFEILFFGHCLPLTGHKRRFYDKYAERGSALCLHAYAVSAHGLENLIKYVNENDVVRQVDIVTRNFCADRLCFLSQSKKSTDDPKFWGEGIIVQDRQSLGSDIGQTD